MISILIILPLIPIFETPEYTVRDNWGSNFTYEHSCMFWETTAVNSTHIKWNWHETCKV